jgi:hypothetical protein
MRLAACLVILTLTVPAVAASARADGGLLVDPGDRLPRGCADRIERRSWEPRPENKVPNHTIPSRKHLRAFHKASALRHRYRINGRFRGRTDEILRWTACKWGYRANIARAVAVVESWWRQSTLGDSGHSIGLMQVKCMKGGDPHRPACPMAERSTAFNTDYWGGFIRDCVDGKMKWLNDVEHAQRYRRGDLWGCIGVWYSGRWYTDPAKHYIAEVKRTKRRHVWTTKAFAGG